MRIAGIKIFPIAWSTSSFWRLKNWDKSLVPKPFSKGVWVWGKPIKVNKNVNKNKIRELTNQLSIELQNTTKIADNFFGH